MPPSPNRSQIGIAEAEAWWRAHEGSVHTQRGRPRSNIISLSQAACAHFGCSPRTWSRIRAQIQRRERERLQTNPLAAAMAAAMAKPLSKQSKINTPTSQPKNTPQIKRGSQTAVPQELSIFAERIIGNLVTAVSASTKVTDLHALRDAIQQRLLVLEPPRSSQNSMQDTASIHLALIDALEAWLSLPHSEQVTRASKSLLAYVQYCRDQGFASGAT
jgi:hypothetical protein